MAATRLRSTPQYRDLAVIGNHLRGGCDQTIQKNSPRWTDKIRFLPERLNEPQHWKKPRRIFVCDMGDLFHESVQFSVIGAVWSTMEKCPQHTFQVLTKRPQRMREFMDWVIDSRNPRHLNSDLYPSGTWPVPNIWLGVSVENQHFADERIPLLLQTPARDIDGREWSQFPHGAD
jgi:protein gp37